jgi:hypothetical protein
LLNCFLVAEKIPHESAEVEKGDEEMESFGPRLAYIAKGDAEQGTTIAMHAKFSWLLLSS